MFTRKNVCFSLKTDKTCVTKVYFLRTHLIEHPSITDTLGCPPADLGVRINMVPL